LNDQLPKKAGPVIGVANARISEAFMGAGTKKKQRFLKEHP